MNSSVSKTFILGWYGHKNIGDESYKIAFRKFFKNKKLDFSDYFNINDNSYNEIILGGGDVFSAGFVNKLFSTNIEKAAMSICLPENFSEEHIKKLKYIILRDKESYNKVAHLDNSYYCPDLSFYLEGDANNGKNIIESLYSSEDRELYNNKVVIAPNCHLLSKLEDPAISYIYFENFVFSMSKLCDNVNASFIFLPFSTQCPWDDRSVGGIINNRCKFWKKNLVIYNRLTVKETLDVIAYADSLISSRLHSSIFSCVCRTPFVDIIHNHKNKNLINDLQMEEFSVQYKNFNYNDIKEKLDFVLNEKETLKKKINNILKSQRELIYEVKQKVCSI